MSHRDPTESAGFGADDLALFADDSVDPVLARRLGASPGGVAMLSPAKSGHAPARGASTPAVPGSTKKMAMRAFADVTNTPVSSCPKKRLFGPGSTVMTPASVMGEARPRARDMCTVATSPLPHHRAQDEAIAELHKENVRLLKMYDFMRERADESEKARAEAQAKLDGKIMEAMSLCSRLDETKRLSKLLKAELRDGKARSLPGINGPFSGSASVERKYEEMLRKQRDEFHDEMERQQAHCQDLEDAIDALQLSPNAVEALLSSLRERSGLQAELHEARRAKEDAEARTRAAEDEVRASRRTAASEARRFKTLLCNRDDLIDRLEAVVTSMQHDADNRAGGAFLHDDGRDDDDEDDGWDSDAAPLEHTPVDGYSDVTDGDQDS
jgi:hypothetical protein